jgi:hypothetical protein
MYSVEISLLFDKLGYHEDYEKYKGTCITSIFFNKFHKNLQKVEINAKMKFIRSSFG